MVYETTSGDAIDLDDVSGIQFAGIADGANLFMVVFKSGAYLYVQDHGKVLPGKFARRF